MLFTKLYYVVTLALHRAQQDAHRHAELRARRLRNDQRRVGRGLAVCLFPDHGFTSSHTKAKAHARIPVGRHHAQLQGGAVHGHGQTGLLGTLLLIALERLGLLLGSAPVSGGQRLDDGHHDGRRLRYDVFHLRHPHIDLHSRLGI